jgi:hypothetical protein
LTDKEEKELVKLKKLRNKLEPEWYKEWNWNVLKIV